MKDVATELVIPITEEEIKDFCNYTEDPNEIHGREWGKKPVVPAMMLLSYALRDMYEKTPARVSANFSKLSHPGEFIFYKTIDDSVTVKITDGEKEVAETRYNFSRDEDSQKIEMSKPRITEGTLDSEVLEGFDDIINPGVAPNRDLLYVISRGSSALAASLQNPESKTELEIASKVDAGHFPVYTALALNIPRSIETLNRREKLVFMTEGQKSGKRSYDFKIAGGQLETTMYFGEVSMTLLSKKFLSRMAEDLD